MVAGPLVGLRRLGPARRRARRPGRAAAGALTIAGPAALGSRRRSRRRAAGGVPAQRGAPRPPRHPARPALARRRRGGPAAARRPPAAPHRRAAGAAARAHRRHRARRAGLRGGRDPAVPAGRDRAARPPRPGAGARAWPWSARPSWPGSGAVDVASDISLESMLAGGLVALLLLPLAVALQRTLRRLVYGDRDFPHRVVSDLRRLDPTSAPEEALGETLTLLSRRLRLSYAAIEVFATGDRPRSGTPRGTPVTVDLVVGGTQPRPAAARGRAGPRPVRPRRPATPRGRRRPGRRARPGRVDQPRAPALPAAPDHGAGGGAAPAPSRPPRRSRARRWPRSRCGWRPPAT